MVDWFGPVADPDIAEMFIEALHALTHHGGLADVYRTPDWPDGFVGVIGGKCVMSADLHEKARRAGITWNPEVN